MSVRHFKQTLLGSAASNSRVSVPTAGFSGGNQNPARSNTKASFSFYFFFLAEITGSRSTVFHNPKVELTIKAKLNCLFIGKIYEFMNRGHINKLFAKWLRGENSTEMLLVYQVDSVGNDRNTPSHHAALISHWWFFLYVSRPQTTQHSPTDVATCPIF